MDADALSKQLIASPSILPSLVAWLAKEDAAALVDHLKSEADRHWWINANRSLELAELIVRIGQARGDPWQVSLGTMARGDALKLLGRTGEAWETRGRAGDLFQKCGDEVGWARTRIGRVGICVDLNRVAEALAEAARARDILGRHGMHEKRLVLDLNTAVVYNLLGDQRQTLSLYRQALATAEALGEIGQQWVAPLYGNIGNAYYLLGDFRQATAYQEHALTLFRDRHNTSACAITELNLAQIAIAQGHYQRALDLLHRAHDLKITLQIPLDAAHIKRQLVECYLLLNRYAEARDLAQQAGAEFHSFGAAYEEALTLLHLAIAEAELANFPAAQAALDAAEPIFASLGAATWVATARLRRGRIALRRGDPAMARHEAMAAITCFQTKGQIIDYATATLLLGQALATESNLEDALEAGKTALHIAQHQNVPAIRDTAHLLLGQVAEAHGDLQRAARQYRAAAATVEHVQRNLTITLRPGFLEDKGEALQALLRLQLRSGAAERAFETLERAKSHVLLNYLANREQLHWAHDDARSRTLIEQLNRLREEHQWFYRLAHEPPVDEESRRGGVDPQQALAEVAARERQMRAITEQIYLHNGEQGAFAQVNAPRLREVRASLD